MNTIIIIIMVCKALAHYVPQSDSPNVGTVLFTQTDLNKKHWSKSNIALLQTRKYFQNLIPSPELITTINEDYVIHLLTYFEDSYKTLKREINNPSLQYMMDIALSDALGGYLKVWVLPITKYAYYGGTVSLKNSLKIFETYDDIKRSLNTDGRGWHNPDENLLNAVAINIASIPRVSLTRNKGDACKHLAYYEQTDAGMTIPLPFINWGLSPITMFVPLKNESIVSLLSPNSSSVLLKYYDVAENCMQSQSPRLDDFDQRFQTWLSTNVAPHLNDDNLYIAFGSILSFMNVTKRFCDKISSTYNKKLNKLKCKALSLRKPMEIFSRKFLIIALILIVEVIWCIPTLILILRSKKRKRKNKKRMSRFFRATPIHSTSKFSQSSQSDDYQNTVSNAIVEKVNDSKRAHGVKLFLKPRTRNLEVDVQFPPYDSKYMMSNKTSKTLHQSDVSSGQVTLVNEVPLKPSLKKILPEFNTISLYEKKIENSNYCTTLCKKESNTINEPVKRSVEKMQELETSETLTLIKNSEKTIQEITYSQVNLSFIGKESNITTCKESNITTCKCCLSAKNDSQDDKRCPCTACLIDEQNEQKRKVKKVTYIEPKIKRENFKSKRREKKAICETVMCSQIDTDKKPQMQKRVKTDTNKVKANNKKDFDISSNQPLLRIKIERPQAAIKVGITSYKERTEATRKPSKIPRLAVKTCKGKTNTDKKFVDLPVKNNNLEGNAFIAKKGLVIKRKALDDSVIKQNSIVDKKLNITL